ncbi:MAG: hypothetical protein OQL06_10000 [Gammaproteobacteria bacterium]|nr:hypothetical protein [Gammaproteobacteria bacterium]
MDLSALETAVAGISVVGATLLAIAATFIGIRLVPKAIAFVKQAMHRG